MSDRERSGACALDVWLLTFLGVLLAFSYLSNVAPPSYDWLQWPITISLCSTLISVVSFETAARRLSTPATISALRRMVVYIAAFIIGVILPYAVMPLPIASRTFRMGVLAVFGLPLFIWLFAHARRHDRSPVRAVVAACTVGLAGLYTLAALLS